MRKAHFLKPWFDHGLRRVFAIIVAVALLSAVVPRNGVRAQQPAGFAKLSVALQQELTASDLLVWSNPSKGTVQVLIQTVGPVSAGLLAAVTVYGGSVVRQFTSINGILAQLPKTNVLTIAARSDVERMSADHLAQQSSSHLEAATGANVVRSSVGGISNLDGTGVGIAILDSGIMAGHSDFKNAWGASRVVASKDLVSSNTNLTVFEALLGIVIQIVGDLLGLLFGNNSNDDGYGHGSHVAGTAAGRAAASGSSRGYMGIAPNANLIDVRVLDSRGLGQTSDVISGIDWVIANKTAYNISVMNLSLGAASAESYLTDPLCRAVRRAVASGITVVAAAGNYGSSPFELYGSITSPGDDPAVITVGSANTHQTDARGDDTVNMFSSRGPTRGYSFDATGTKQYDNLLKPDLIAPGNKIVSAESSGCYIAKQYPQLCVSGSGSTG
ncbi:MAG TPA: S8 family serine peptidase, partial [Blastocatellia bacterium]|nr:S8 family serine peptidase [Blastocatellia bacterium]